MSWEYPATQAPSHWKWLHTRSGLEKAKGREVHCAAREPWVLRGIPRPYYYRAHGKLLPIMPRYAIKHPWPGNDTSVMSRKDEYF
jgi:hypothetical protein